MEQIEDAMKFLKHTDEGMLNLDPCNGNVAALGLCDKERRSKLTVHVCQRAIFARNQGRT